MKRDPLDYISDPIDMADTIIACLEAEEALQTVNAHLRERLALAEAVAEAAAADLKCSRDAHCEVFKEADAEWLAGCTESEKKLIEALSAWRAFVEGEK